MSDSDSRENTVFLIGMKHYRAGIPRHANPCIIAAYNAGKRKPEKEPRVIEWFAGWDLAKATDPKNRPVAQKAK